MIKGDKERVSVSACKSDKEVKCVSRGSGKQEYDDYNRTTVEMFHMVYQSHLIVNLNVQGLTQRVDDERIGLI